RDDHPRSTQATHRGLPVDPSEAPTPLWPRRAGHHRHVDPRHVVGAIRPHSPTPAAARARPRRRRPMAQPHPRPLRATLAGDLRMNVLVLGWALLVSQVLLTLAMVCSAYRMLRGPRAQDRVLGLDTLYVCAMLLIVTVGVRTGHALFFEAALII